jgi:hypothetical protein
MRERKLVTAELVDVGVALADPALRGLTRDALDAARAAALGLSPVELVCQCATCREPWTPARGPGRVLAVFEQDRRGPGGTLRVGFICGDCDGGGDAEAWGRVRRRMRRGLPGHQRGRARGRARAGVTPRAYPALQADLS